jgi:hypothetical protein
MIAKFCRRDRHDGDLFIRGVIFLFLAVSSGDVLDLSTVKLETSAGKKSDGGEE